MLELNKIHNMDNVDGMKMLDDNSIDLVVTSPPYDNLRTYNGFSFDFENVAKQLYRVVKKGGVVVWVVADQTIDGSESGTSFRQALYFKEIGFNLHDTMIWSKMGFTAAGDLSVRYPQSYEFMFVLSKGKPTSFNPIKDRKNIHVGDVKNGTIRQTDGSFKPMSGSVLGKYGFRFNVWEQFPTINQAECDGHPAPFPEQLASDHIISWSNEDDIVMDPFMGSGTTAKAALLNRRKFIGFEISKEYCDIANKRIDYYLNQTSIFDFMEEGASHAQTNHP